MQTTVTEISDSDAQTEPELLVPIWAKWLRSTRPTSTRIMIALLSYILRFFSEVNVLNI